VTIRKDGAVLRQLNTLFNVGVTRELTDGQLLERFSTGPGEVAELAFEALVERHGAMVLRVCRAQLADLDDTHDAFQATFLILIKKARSLWVRDSLGPWLHQVAFRTASCARSAAARRRNHERRAAEMASTLDSHENRLAPDWEDVLHEEINRLPECYRVPIVLCDLQGCTCEEVARRIGRPVGTVKSWRSRARERLRDRLIRRGLAPSAALGTALAQDIARATVPETAIRLAVRALSDGTTAGKVSASVHMLVKGVLKTMLLSKLRMTATAVFASVVLTAGLGTFAWVVAGDSHRPVDQAQPRPPRPPFADQPHRTTGPSSERGETWSLTLREAIHIGLDNADDIRVISFGTPSRIAPIETDVDPQHFKADVMAKVRSIEQQYWNLAQAHAQLEATTKSVEFAEEIQKREAAELQVGRGTIADVAEAAQRLEMFNLDLVTRTSDVITTERLLRKALGLPSADDRRIVPVTAPLEAPLEPDWEISKAAMLENHPEIVLAKARLKQAEAGTAGTVASRVAQIKSQKDSLQTVVDRNTHALARIFVEIGANYKQFTTASRLRAAAARRLDAQRAYYKEGRITVDRFLDCVSQYGAAIAAEVQYKTTYNNAIVALEEAKGTLLECDEITVVDGPRSTVSAAKAPVSQPVPFAPPQSLQPLGAPATVPPSARLTTNEPRPNEPPPNGQPAAGKTFSFDLTFGIGSMPVQIRWRCWPSVPSRTTKRFLRAVKSIGP